MRNILGKDLFIAERKSVITEYDRRVLSELYLPLIGNYAYTVYMKLLSLSERPDAKDPQKLSSLLKTTGLTITQIDEGMCYLEGIGLMQSCVHKKNNTRIFRLFSPKSPAQFFADDIFRLMLRDSVGESELMRLRFSFMDLSSEDSDIIDVSLSFGEVFHLDYTVWEMEKSISTTPLQMRSTAKAVFEFDTDLFNTILAEKGFKTELITPEDRQWLQSCSSLFGVKEESLANIVARNFADETVSLDRDNVIQDIKNSVVFSSNKKKSKPVYTHSRNSTDAKSTKASEFEKYSPVEYLKSLQGTKVIAKNEFDLIRRLGEDFLLPGPIINVILDFTILKCDGKIVDNYVERIASTILRNNLAEANVRDVMNYLADINRKTSKNPGYPASIGDSTTTNSTSNDDDISQEDVEKYLK